MRRVASFAVLLLLASLALSACSRDRSDLIEASVDAETRADLQASLGAPDDRQKMGPVEIWTYEASDGTVTFLITGEKVQLQTSGPARSREER